jgi:RNA polymerase sigma factor (sigma-70 family)
MDTVTSATLLEAVKDGQDGQAWNRFISRYRPMIVSFAKRLGLDKSDAEDIGQETLLVFLQDYREGQYDRMKGKFRSWLFGIAHNQALNFQRKKLWENVVPEETRSTGFITRIESPDEVRELWEEEWQRLVLRTCMEEIAKEVSPQTLAAFKFYVVKEWSAEKIARHLEMSPNAVYIAKNRVLRLIRKIKTNMEEIL